MKETLCGTIDSMTIMRSQKIKKVAVKNLQKIKVNANAKRAETLMIRSQSLT